MCEQDEIWTEMCAQVVPVLAGVQKFPVVLVAIFRLIGTTMEPKIWGKKGHCGIQCDTNLRSLDIDWANI